ncbi:MAG: hypothetical protein K8H86_02605, partial [Ignavibacteriaceae bacterium]|nr:hypothetical protein [Ignavibacteriaceae bacterium]
KKCIGVFMLVGVNIQKIWEFANKQRFFLREVKSVSNLSNMDKFDIDTLIKLDERYNYLSEHFLGAIYFSHIKYIIPITQKAAESFEQLCSMFPEVNRFMR